MPREARHDAEKNGDCAIAFSALTEKRRTCRQNGKTVRYLRKMRKKRPFYDLLRLSEDTDWTLQMCWSGHMGRRFPEIFAGFEFTIAFDPGMAFLFTGLLYVYVVTVNKAPRFLWITLVYLIQSMSCHSHNRMHSVCGSSGYTRVTFRDFRRRQSYPVYVHNGST